MGRLKLAVCKSCSKILLKPPIVSHGSKKKIGLNLKNNNEFGTIMAEFPFFGLIVASVEKFSEYNPILY